jgi:kynurenine formamidase
VPLPPEFTELAQRVRNWGRWGPEDERGTLNLITTDVVQKAAACVQSGRSFSLALPLWEHGPQIGVVRGRTNPHRTMSMINEAFGDADAFRTSDDVVYMSLQAATHWDALAHATYGGHLYNGFPADAIDTKGANRCGIDKAGSITTRGVLLDIARLKDVERLDGGYAITPSDLEGAESRAGVTVEAGDVVLLRTGHIRLLAARDREGYAYTSPGPGMACAEWFHERDVAAVATDTMTFEVFPFERDDIAFPLHMLHLVEMGMLQGQNWDLEALASDCADDGRYAFLLAASPEPFRRGTGAPVHPVAVK